MKTPGLAHRLLPPLALALAVAACRSDPPPTGAAPATTASAKAAEPAGPHPAPSPKTGEEARALVDRWAAAQNEGKLDAYTALYASKFEGVRRSGPRVARLDRARWMKEREGMFKKKMEVRVSDVQVTPTLTGATVSFVQRWSSGAFTDEGPKRMVLVRSGADLRIGREEMLRSTLKGKEEAAPLPADKLAFVVRGPAPMLVLDASPKDEWGDMAPWLETRGDVVMTRRSVEAGKLPAEIAGFRGKRVELYGKSGRACVADVTGFSLLGRVTPHFGTVGRWDGKGESEGKPPLSSGEIAQEAWDLTAGSEAAPGGRLLVAMLSQVTGKCEEGLWGRVVEKGDGGAETREAKGDAKPKEAKALAVVEAKAADDATREKVMAELRKLPTWAEIQKDYEGQKAGGDAAQWDGYQDAKPTVLVMELPGGVSLVTASVTAGAGCGGFGATLSAAWELKDGKLTLVRDPDGQGLLPLSAADVDGDGRFELFLQEGVIRSSGTRYDRWDRLAIPFLDCGC
ncbi:MAG TPA: hypothetical protein VLS89_13155 [Candidatus Nanopelagicales bacterium]|nr:hypothetical protein [Candidatus Nanopelagicales bacterium]